MVTDNANPTEGTAPVAPALDFDPTGIYARANGTASVVESPPDAAPLPASTEEQLEAPAPEVPTDEAPTSAEAAEIAFEQLTPDARSRLFQSEVDRAITYVQQGRIADLPPKLQEFARFYQQALQPQQDPQEVYQQGYQTAQNNLIARRAYEQTQAVLDQFEEQMITRAEADQALRAIDPALTNVRTANQFLVKYEEWEAGERQRQVQEQQFAPVYQKAWTDASTQYVQASIATLKASLPELKALPDREWQEILQKGMQKNGWDGIYETALEFAASARVTKGAPAHVAQAAQDAMRERMADQALQSRPAPDGRGGSNASGQAQWSTKEQARNLHAQGRITTAQMRQINNDPTIPEGYGG